jgi:hypothetical protein
MQLYRGNIDPACVIKKREELYCMHIKFVKNIHIPSENRYRVDYHFAMYDPELLKQEQKSLAKIHMGWIEATGFDSYEIQHDGTLVKNDNDIKDLEI